MVTVLRLRVLIWLGILLITPFLAIALLLGLAMGTPLPKPEVPLTSEIVDQKERLIARLYLENRREIPVREMPQYLLDAIVAVEDDRFYRHYGIDPIGIARAMYRNVRSMQVLEGGSTITQQLAKNLYLTHERTVARKMKEALLTLKMEQMYTKREILGMYWNTIYLGEGTYGVELASQRYFGKPARELTLAEAALLAGLPRQPEFYAPTENPEGARDRRNLVLDFMATSGFVSPQEAAAAKAEPVTVAPVQETTGEAPYFVDFVLEQLEQINPTILANIRRGGYRIQTTLDLDVQRAANEAIETTAPKATADERGILQPQVALVALNPSNGQVLAMVGGREKQQGLLNRVTARRQPGSAFKPFVYGAALETRRYSVISTFVDQPTSFPAGNGKQWRPENFQREYSRAPMGMREALRQSKNVVAVQWLNQLKPGPVIEFARRLGIPAEVPLVDNLTLALGTSELSPLEITSSFAPFGNGGFQVKPSAILRITDSAGSLVYSQTEKPFERALDEDLAYVMTDLLKDVVRPGGSAGQVAGLIGGRPAAGKTGTTENSRDSWFVGYTRELVASVWVGHDIATETEFTGAITAAPIWADFIKRAEEGIPFSDWVQPAGVDRVRICVASGLLANATCTARSEVFLRGTAPKRVDPKVYWNGLSPVLPPPTGPGKPSTGAPTEPLLELPGAPLPTQPGSLLPWLFGEELYPGGSP